MIVLFSMTEYNGCEYLLTAHILYEDQFNYHIKHLYCTYRMCVVLITLTIKMVFYTTNFLFKMRLPCRSYFALNVLSQKNVSYQIVWV